MPRFKLTLEYDGTGFAGWQRQPDRLALQEVVEAAAAKLFGQPTELVAAGRTDAGVHALGQVAHCDAPKPMQLYNVLHGLNFHLRPLTLQVVVTHAETVAENFHARFDAVERCYAYYILNRPARGAIARDRAWHVPEPLDVARMSAGAALLLGTHDFTSFRSTDCQAKSPIRTLDALQVTRQGESIVVTARARSFLHHQIRNMAGSLRLLGNHRWSVDDMAQALAARDRRAGGATAPPQGLFLTRVSYPPR